eukprot:jgi/Botrbrau1/15998/Bobra.200_2s0003.1
MNCACLLNLVCTSFMQFRHATMLQGYGGPHPHAPNAGGIRAHCKAFSICSVCVPRLQEDRLGWLQGQEGCTPPNKEGMDPPNKHLVNPRRGVPSQTNQQPARIADLLSGCVSNICTPKTLRRH